LSLEEGSQSEFRVKDFKQVSFELVTAIFPLRMNGILRYCWTQGGCP